MSNKEEEDEAQLLEEDDVVQIERETVPLKDKKKKKLSGMKVIIAGARATFTLLRWLWIL